jgi:formylmethanofuran dehydrogenase subunit E-like metal-binding protein
VLHTGHTTVHVSMSVPVHSKDDIIKTGLKWTWRKGVEWINLARDRDQ